MSNRNDTLAVTYQDDWAIKRNGKGLCAPFSPASVRSREAHRSSLFPSNA